MKSWKTPKIKKGVIDYVKVMADKGTYAWFEVSKEEM